MLTVFLIRAFTLDLVEHLARTRAPQSAVAIEPHNRRRFGVNNSTGLGMAPFLMNHPVLLNNWVMARETALQRVRSVRPRRPTKSTCSATSSGVPRTMPGTGIPVMNCR